MPKIIGTYVIDQAAEIKFGFFLMYSSISTIFSSIDLAAYIAGNMYLDSYCSYRGKECEGKALL